MTGWDTDFLEQKIRALVQCTKYRGDVTVTFPITNSRIQVLKDSLIDVLDDRSQQSAKFMWYKRYRPNENKVSEKEAVIRAVEKLTSTATSSWTGLTLETTTARACKTLLTHHLARRGGTPSRASRTGGPCGKNLSRTVFCAADSVG